ncbi:Rgg/GadR/MutR family transcriptional regulator [Periweissella cryptocerci]|uniref:Rgg/GadR/MutR family transcriptional regulator n=1 Tax=Periweissella cryptocerci TaxID=2506420 RepID=A0A4P6YX18_9LACO|nr:Rgg/GadR/MutR family transcriptional regulator [Periweissella cryptocerci]QBO37361.1 Rgg/GadR/MutR family transcriptional regulator [Periweissella cryptocerci]
MNTYGETFQAIRLNKNVSLRAVSEGIASDSFVGKFEKGLTNISFDKLVHLVERLNVTVEEFLFLDSTHNDYFSVLLDEMNTAYTNADISKLIALADEQLRIYRDTNVPSYKCNWIMVRSLISDLEDEKLDDEFTNYIVNYLVGISEWTLYEVILFANSVHIFDMNTIMLLTDEILNKDALINFEKNKRIVVDTLLNIARVFIEDGQRMYASRILAKVKRISMDDIYYSSRTNFLFVQGLYEIKFGDRQAGEKRCDNALQVMELLGDSELVALKRHYLDSFN